MQQRTAHSDFTVTCVPIHVHCHIYKFAFNQPYAILSHIERHQDTITNVLAAASLNSLMCPIKLPPPPNLYL